MNESASTLGFIAILMLYFVVGLTSVAGSIVITRKIFAPKGEQIFYGLSLVAIAGFYLAFAAYFGGGESAWRFEQTAVVAFAVLGVIGMRISGVLILGYLLHGVWDGLHELQAHVTGLSIFEPGQATEIPLAYGVFCAAFDIGIAAYFVVRRAEWAAAWRTSAGNAAPGTV